MRSKVKGQEKSEHAGVAPFLDRTEKKELHKKPKKNFTRNQKSYTFFALFMSQIDNIYE